MSSSVVFALVAYRMHVCVSNNYRPTNSPGQHVPQPSYGHRTESARKAVLLLGDTLAKGLGASRICSVPDHYVNQYSDNDHNCNTHT